MRRRKRNKNILIEVAAQHPLKDGLYPDEEFTARLDRAIELYKEKTADECFIASKIFFTEEESFGQLYSVCSPNQLMRKNLFYMEFGIIPMIITVPTANMFHNFLKELLGNVPYIISEDHNYQGETSKEAIRTRRERLPDYEKK
ncbi:MAG: hypothetical protein IJW27_05730 [Clostridia bacterium]|nr:hypothetical protein [Clostridia bacterium]